MALVVDLPAGREAERAYILGVVLGDMLGFPYEVRTSAGREVVLRRSEQPGDPVIVLPDVLFAAADARPFTAEILPSEPLRWAEVPAWVGAEDERVPVLYGIAGTGEPVCERTDAGVRFTVDLLGGAFFMLTRLEEVVRPEADQHGRFPAHASLAWREGFLERAIVDEYVDLLWAAIHACWPDLRRRPGEPRVLLSHDVDDAFATRGVPPRSVLRQALGDVVRRRDARLGLQRLRAMRSRKLSHDPFNTFGFLMDVSERHGLRSAFYFICEDDDGPFSASYRLSDPPIAMLVAMIAGRGHEVGLHGSYASFDDAGRLARELGTLTDLAEALGIPQERWGGRQHYLRWRAPATWEDWEQAGLHYDSTVGYADHAGFRSGTCHEHRVFSLTRGSSLELRERPLIVMEGTLFDYMGLGPEAARERAVRLARRCRSHGGDFTLLCHNSWLAGRAAKQWYQSLVEEIAGT